MKSYVVITTSRSRHWSDRGGQPIQGVVLHATASPPQSTPESTLRYLRHNDRQVSAHEFLTPPDPETKGMVVYRLVPDERASHAVGHSQLPGHSGNPNPVTWSIEVFRHTNELDEPWPPELYAVAVERLALACQRHDLGADDVYLHREIDTRGKTCPGMGVDADQVRTDVDAWLSQPQSTVDDRVAALRRGLQELDQELETRIRNLLTI